MLRASENRCQSQSRASATAHPTPTSCPRGSSLPFNECSETSRCCSEASPEIRPSKSHTDPAKQVLSFHSPGAQEDTEV